MAVDLADLIPSLERELSPPGSDFFPDATEDEWLGQLQDAFWEGKLEGFDVLSDYSESDGLVSPITGTDELARQYQQLVVIIAAMRVLRGQMMGTNTLFRAVAGPVEFETQNSAQLLRDVLAHLNEKLQLLLTTMGSLSSSSIAYFNGVVERTDSICFGFDAFWL